MNGMDALFNEIDDFDDDGGYVLGEIDDNEFEDIEEVEGRAMLGEWQFIDQLDISLEIEPIDAILLEHARNEVNHVLDNILRHIPNGLDPRVELTHLDFFRVWFDRCLLDSVKSWLTKYMGETIEEQEIKAFIKVELMLAFYNCSPERYFDPRYKSRYNPIEEEMTLFRYKAILRAFGMHDEPNVNIRRRNQNNLMQWDPPFTPNHDLELAMSNFRTMIARIGFIPAITMACIDDDLLRMRSRLVQLFGFTQINNPAKGMGIVQHAAVSVVTGLFLCSHVQRRNESTVDSVTVLQNTLSGATVERLINLTGNHFLWDRGYGGPDGVINRTSVMRGLHVSGTAKRVPSFPFTFGTQTPGPRRMKISEEGSEAMYWAKKKITGTDGRPSTMQYAMGHRSGLGRVVLMQTTYPKCGPGKYAFITEKGIDDVEKTERQRKSVSNNKYYDDFFKHFEENVVRRLTLGQSTPEWFLLRKFCFTGTTADIAWKAACNDDEIHYFIGCVLSFLGFKFNQAKIVRNNDLHIIGKSNDIRSLRRMRTVANMILFLKQFRILRLRTQQIQST